MFKFAGDALVIVWPPPSDPLEESAPSQTELRLLENTRRAMQCAIGESPPLSSLLSPPLVVVVIIVIVECGGGLEIRDTLSSMTVDDLSLSIKVGVGIGDVNVLFVGGERGRIEYLCTGAPMLQAFGAEHECKAKQVIMFAYCSDSELACCLWVIGFR